MPRFPLAAALLVPALAASAFADVNVEVGNGDKITGTLSPATEAETFNFRVPQGAVITVKAKSAKKGPALTISLQPPAAAGLGNASGTAPSIKGVVAPDSGLYSVRVTSQNGVSTGDYSLSIGWKSPTSFTASADLAAAGTSTLDFAVDASAAATLSAKPAKGSAATAALTQLTAPGPAVTPLTGTTTKRTLTAGGSYVLTFANAGAAQGVVAATVKVKPPKPTKRKIALTTKVIGSGNAQGDAAYATVLGALGGTVTVPAIPQGEPGAEISGSSVTVPPGALGAGTAIVIATSPGIDGPGPTQPAGPPVFFGPEGQKFAGTATVTIPYDAAYDSDTSALVIYTRDSKGKVTAVPPPYTFDSGTHTVSFQTSHFSSFQTTAPDTGTGAEMLTYGNVTTPEDVCLAYEQGSPQFPLLFLAAEGAAKTVAGLRVSAQPTALLDREVWAGGGTSSVANGTISRQQFLFPDPVQSVFSLSDGQVWIATTRQIFKVDTADKVFLVAGTGATGDAGDGSSATSATFTSIRSIVVALDESVFVVDAGAHRIRLIDAVQNFTIQAWAGTGQAAFGTDGASLATTTFLDPSDIEFSQDGGLYVADAGRVRKLKPGIVGMGGDVNVTIAGDAAGATGASGDDGPLLAARFRSISGISTFIDVNNPNPALPFLVVCDRADHTVRLLDQTSDHVRLLAGQHGSAGNAPDFSAKTGRLDTPTAVAALVNQVLIADKGNGKIRTLISVTVP